MGKDYQNYSSLQTYAESVRYKDFVWGRFDCLLFAANCIKILDPKLDVMRGFRGKYKSRLGAEKILKKETEAGTFKAFIFKLCDNLELETIDPNYAQRGDLIMFRGEDINGDTDDAVGICIGASFMYAAPIGGLAFIPMGLAEHCWRI